MSHHSPHHAALEEATARVRANGGSVPAQLSIKQIAARKAAAEAAVIEAGAAAAAAEKHHRRRRSRGTSTSRSTSVTASSSSPLAKPAHKRSMSGASAAAAAASASTSSPSRASRAAAAASCPCASRAVLSAWFGKNVDTRGPLRWMYYTSAEMTGVKVRVSDLVQEVRDSHTQASASRLQLPPRVGRMLIQLDLCDCAWMLV